MKMKTPLNFILKRAIAGAVFTVMSVSAFSQTNNLLINADGPDISGDEPPQLNYYIWAEDP